MVDEWEKPYPRSHLSEGLLGKNVHGGTLWCEM
jgi:hypothetical protein